MPGAATARLDARQVKEDVPTTAKAATIVESVRAPSRSGDPMDHPARTKFTKPRGMAKMLPAVDHWVAPPICTSLKCRSFRSSEEPR